MLSGPSLFVIEQHDRRAVPSGAVEPHVRWCLGRSVGFLQHLHRCLIGLEDAPFEKLAVQVIIDQSQVAFRGLQRPVGQRLTRQTYPKTTELLFLAVQGHALNVFLVDHMGDGGCRSVAARDRRLRHGGLHNRRARAAVVAGTAGVQMLHVLDHLHLRRNHLELPAHFRAHCMQPTRTLGTVLLFLRQRVVNLFGRHAFQNSAARAALLLALVRADRLQFGLFYNDPMKRLTLA